MENTDIKDQCKYSFDLARELETPIWVFDIDRGRILFANRSACDLWNSETEVALCSRDLSTDMSPNVALRIRQYLADFRESNSVFKELWTLYPANIPINTMVKFSRFHLSDGRIAMLCEAPEVLKMSAQNIRSCEALLHTDVMITLYHENGKIIYMNPAARNSLQDSCKFFSESFLCTAAASKFIENVKLYGEYRSVAQIRTSNGNQWHDLSAKYCRDAVTGDQALLLTSIDVSNLKEARDSARFLADRDQLTGCYNRSYLQNYISRQSRDKVGQNYIFIYFDIDHFKQINDRFGHEIGDEVLRQIVFRVRGVIRHEDILARFGGDEFGIIMEKRSSEDDAQRVIERIRSAVSKPIQVDSLKIDVAISLGITSFSAHEVAFTKVMSEADIALYNAKHTGKNKAVIFDENLGIAARQRDELELELKQAIKKDNFVLHYQPRVDTTNNKVVAAEALVRWEHPTRGLIYPDGFIAHCEENGMIEDLGELIVRKSFEQVIQWCDQKKDINVSINISPRQFKSDLLMHTLKEYAELDGFPTGKVELEITENALIGNPDDIACKLKSITKMGYTIAIDDFGKGYSNLFYISKFPIKCLKIDRAFIAQIPKSGPVLELILALGKQISATVVAEGVETSEQLQWLKDKGCNQIQGFYFSRPQPVDKFLEFSGF